MLSLNVRQYDHGCNLGWSHSSFTRVMVTIVVFGELAVIQLVLLHARLLQSRYDYVTSLATSADEAAQLSSPLDGKTRVLRDYVTCLAVPGALFTTWQ